MTLAAAAILLFFVMDPIGNIPLFLAALKPVEPARHVVVVAREPGRHRDWLIAISAAWAASALQMVLDGVAKLSHWRRSFANLSQFLRARLASPNDTS